LNYLQNMIKKSDREEEKYITTRSPFCFIRK